MKIKFTKDHPSGIKEGNVHHVDRHFASRMIEGGFAQIHEDDSEEEAPKEKKAPKERK